MKIPYLMVVLYANTNGEIGTAGGIVMANESYDENQIIAETLSHLVPDIAKVLTVRLEPINTKTLEAIAIYAITKGIIE